MSIKKLLSLVLTLACVPVFTFAQGTVDVQEPTLDGDTYIISNAANMHWINQNWEENEDDFKGKNFKLEKGITIDLGDWNSNIILSTEFDGNGSTIKYSSQFFENMDPSGLFLELQENAYVHDLTIDGAVMVLEENVSIGLLSNSVSGYYSGSSQGLVQVSNVTVNGSIAGSPRTAGGLVGTVNYRFNVNNVINNATVESATHAGGIIGYIYDSSYSISLENVANTGTIYLSDVDIEFPEARVGGLIGYVESYSKPDNFTGLQIWNCYNRGSLYIGMAEGKELPQNFSMSLGLFVGATSRNITLTNIYSYIDGDIYDLYPLDINKAGVYRLGVRQTSVDFIGSLDLNNNKELPEIAYQSGKYLFYEVNGELSEGSSPKNSFSSGEITYMLNYKAEGSEGSWLQSNMDEYPVLSFEGGMGVYKHGDSFNSDNHEYDENGICIHSDHCYQKPVFTQANILGYIVSNAGQLRYLNENWSSIDYSSRYDIHFGEIEYDEPSGDASMDGTDGKKEINYTIKPVMIDLTSDNWYSNISVLGNVYGHGSTIKFISRYDENAYSPVLFSSTVTGLFNTIYLNDYNFDNANISDLNIYGKINDESSGIESSAVGMLANSVCTQHTVLNFKNIKVYNLEGGSGSDGITAYDGVIGGVIGELLTVDYDGAVNFVDVISSVSIYGGCIMGGIVGSSNSVPVDISYSAFKGRIQYSSDLDLDEFGITTIGGILGWNNSEVNVNYCYTNGILYNPDMNDLYMGTFIGYQALTEKNNNVSNSYAFYGDVNNWNSTSREPRNYTESGSMLPPAIGNMGGVLPPANEEEASKIVTADENFRNYFFYPSVDYYQNGVMKDYFRSGKILERLSDSFSNLEAIEKFSQNLGEYEADDLEYFPRLTSELTEEELAYHVFPTCAENVFSNEDRRQYGEDGSFLYCEHNFDIYHICKYCKAVDTEYFKENNEIYIETTEDLTDMTDQVSILTQAGIPADIKVYADIVYDDVDYQDLSVGQLEALLPEKASIGTKDKQFEGSFEGKGHDFVNFAFQQNGLFNYIGNTGEVSNLNIVNGVILNNLKSEDIVKDVENNIIYAAALANVNHGKISYSSFVGAMATPDGAQNVTNCLVGENYGEVSYSFAYFTDLETVKENSPNKAAIIVKGNCGVGRGSAGQIKKVAANTNAKTETTGDPYYTPDEAELLQGDRVFSNEEFASGVVAYWMNFEGDGYLGNYTCMYRQGTLTPELSDGGIDAVHKIVYSSNKPSAVISGKAFENSGATLTIDLSEAATSVKIGSTLATLTNDNTRATIVVPETSEADVIVEVTFAGATDIETVTPESGANVMVVDGRLMVFNAEGQDVTLYNVNGSVVCSSVVTSSRVALPAINRGIYFVKVGTTTKKILF